jgi:hypothetical protein
LTEDLVQEKGVGKFRPTDDIHKLELSGSENLAKTEYDIISGIPSAIPNR